MNDYTYDEDTRDFVNKGAWRKFDQTVFTQGVTGIGENLDKLRDWGFYYVPTAC